ncbi:ABC transporter ATP-binding protein [Lysinibacillus sp. FSL M8-0216]|uniref:Carnitine transport ATP-binding protein OpuCA n=1 Tax=Lysinibacillus fusiformis TaxID=28031 RepID=A0A1H9CVJ2_9BACI|nr:MULTISPECIES: ABC transporter ATP-binding protein [Lysinibacillus]EAZ84755.1 ABC transporter-like protein [Bacillus sp. B14905]HAU33871.1 ABC transporter ATP-binding protein [Lysinibacillus sp.]MCG7434319.1 ABC transporter ATP-binding protein [Lysinibacillus fusiformis]MED4074940.1 ABC transporter ATP-binding protein [Lysinibacillus fusiformis]MED4668755.1 ABC transporter ATP-binding protein [Lysinibacillus fusiformis]
MSYLVIEGLHKNYGSSTVLSNINMKIDKGEFITLLGPSGCGKSTILRIVAGLTDATAGKISIEGKDMNGVQPKDRQVGMVFQSYALFPNMTVQENVAFGLRMQKENSVELEQRVQDMLELVHLSEKAHAYPKELSGGQQQRVALARALIVRPKVLLLDEPLSALDAQIRKKLQADLRAIQRKLNMTMILVTHDQEEAMAVSDRIFVMNNGSIAQSGTPTEIYTRPDNEFIANFIGHYNVFSRQVLQQMLGEPLPEPHRKFAIRPEALHFDKRNGDLCLTGIAKQSLMSGNIIRTMFEGEVLFTIEQLHQQGYSIEMGATYKCYVAKEDVIALS